MPKATLSSFDSQAASCSDLRRMNHDRNRQLFRPSEISQPSSSTPEEGIELSDVSASHQHKVGEGYSKRITGARRTRAPAIPRSFGKEPPSPTTSLPLSVSSDRTRVNSAHSPKFDDEVSQKRTEDAEYGLLAYSFAATPPSPIENSTEKRGESSSSLPSAPHRPSPSMCMLFSSLRRHDFTVLFVPAVILSIASGALPPLMTRVLGNAFDAYTEYNPMGLSSASVPPESKVILLHGIITSVWQLCALAAATGLLSTSMVSIWICIGERNAKSLRDRLYAVISVRKLEWFDKGMGLEEKVDTPMKGDETAHESSASPNSRGAGGLLAKFARETDEVRIATSQQFGQLLQHLTTMLACLALAVATNWSLTLVILAGIPVTVMITVICEVLTGPLLKVDREATAETASIIERVIIAISTVKAFNAQDREARRFAEVLKKGSSAYNRTTFWWAVRLGFSSTLTFAMFVQGFWYGSHLVQAGKASAGTVMTVFWSSLLASAHLRLVIQNLTVLEKGKVSMAALHHLINPPLEPIISGTSYPSRVPESRRSSAATAVSSHESLAAPPGSPLPPRPPPKSPQRFKRTHRSHAVNMSIESIPHMEMLGRPTSPTSPGDRHSFPKVFSPLGRRPSHKLQRRRGDVRVMRRIMPSSRAHGEISLHNVTFAYPTRPNDPVLREVNLYLAAGDTTYIVGGSGSGKSTVTQLILGLYLPEAGTVTMDDKDLRFLDPSWRKTHIAAVTQQPIIFDLSVHDNVAIGLCGLEGATDNLQANHVPVVARERVIEACRMALIHDFVRDLPDGYDTPLGARGTSLSGGQKQRISIARACLRNPTVLILDEATSALDPTSRLLVNEAVKRHRRGRTTVIVTHDLSQISSDDFVYLLDNGIVAEQGYRDDLEGRQVGYFKSMALLQSSPDDPNSSEVTAQPGQDAMKSCGSGDEPNSPTGLDVRAARTLSHLPVEVDAAERPKSWQRKSVWGHASMQSFSTVTAAKDVSGVRVLSSTSNSLRGLRPLHLPEQQQRRAVEEAPWLRTAGTAASVRRDGVEVSMRRKWTAAEIESADAAKYTSLTIQPGDGIDAISPRVGEVAIGVWRSQPRKVLFLFGIFCSIASGGVTPAFSYVLAQLLATMGRTGQGAVVLRYSLLVLLLAFVEGLFAFARSWVMELVADGWVSSLRQRAYALVMAQDKTWFDEPGSTPSRIVTNLVKDADDARELVGRVVGQLSVVVAMIFVGILWAMIVGWQLTLVGLAFGPLFILAMGLQSRYVARAEAGNKVCREEVSKRFYDMVSNVRGIRAMGLESVFSANFDDAAREAQTHGMRCAWLSGFGFGLGEALTYLAEALMFYVGAVLIIRGVYDFERMVIVFNLIIFAVSFAASTMAYLPNVSKAIASMHDLSRLLALSSQSSETPGSFTPAINGHIAFRNVGFSYAARKDVEVLHDLTFEVGQGETVAIVGGSGSGKSTIVSLLQRLYESGSGSILLDGRPLNTISTAWLREHMTVVSQQPNLFDMTVADNIAYGANAALLDSMGSPLEAKDGKRGRDDELRSTVIGAAETARVDGFVRSLPKGYDTPVGADATLISGGQAQRIAIARALVRTRACMLILDECTSALDAANQDAIARTLLGSGEGDEGVAAARRRAGKHAMTTLVVTHKVDLMRRCDRILVVERGAIVQQGTYSQLMNVRGGKFAELAGAGEWGA